MITSKNELKFYIAADTMINRGYFAPSITKRLAHIFNPDIIVDFLKSMRCYSYYSHREGLVNTMKSIYYKRRFLKLSKRCGFSIGCDCFGYGLMIHHYGTIVCGSNNRIGNFAAINTSTCIIQNGSTIGDFFFLATGAVVSKKVCLGDNVKVAANSVVNNSINEANIVLAGQPAAIRKYTKLNWLQEYDTEDQTWQDRYKKILNLKERMNL